MKFRPTRRIALATVATLATGALSLGMVAPAYAATGYAIGGKSATTQVALAGYGLGGVAHAGTGSGSGGTAHAATDPVVIHAPSMASSEGCPDPDELEDGSIQVTMIHADGVEYNCNTGDYTIN